MPILALIQSINMTDFIRLEERVYLLDRMVKDQAERLEGVEDRMDSLENSTLIAMLAVMQLQRKTEEKRDDGYTKLLD